MYPKVAKEYYGGILKEITEELNPTLRAEVSLLHGFLRLRSRLRDLSVA